MSFFLLDDTSVLSKIEMCQNTTEYKISPETSWQASSGIALHVPAVIRRQKWRQSSGVIVATGLQAFTTPSFKTEKQRH